jgi:hypothetical protein
MAQILHTKKSITDLQQNLNRWSRDNKSLGRQILIVDGVFGSHTKALLHAVRYDLGYKRVVSDEWDENFLKRLHHPHELNPSWGQDKEALSRGLSRRRKRRLWVLRNRIRSVLTPGVTHFDGVPVAKAAVPILRWCRQHGWYGRLVSGYRTPAYSESLCFAMCGHPTCPGKCAGRSTNHAYCTPERFAVDVSDYVRFGQIVRNCPVRPHISNHLPIDPVHFSPQGN